MTSMGPPDPQDRQPRSEQELDKRFDAPNAEIARLTTERDEWKREAEELDKHFNVFKAEIARLIAERDKWKRDAESLKWRQRALSAEAKRDSLQCVVDSQDWEKVVAENDALKADLAAARKVCKAAKKWLVLRVDGRSDYDGQRADRQAVALEELEEALERFSRLDAGKKAP